MWDSSGSPAAARYPRAHCDFLVFVILPSFKMCEMLLVPNKQELLKKYVFYFYPTVVYGIEAMKVAAK